MPEPIPNGQFTTANAKHYASQGHAAKQAGSPRSAYRQAVKLQQLILSDAVSHSELIESDSEEVRALAKPTDLAALARAWCDLEETKRKLKMRPTPKAIDVTLKKHGGKAAGQSFSDH